MRPSLLRHLACPACAGALACVTTGAGDSGTRLGPPRPWSVEGPLTAALDQLPPWPGVADPEARLATGLLVCGCGRWFPLERGIPELLPDHLRAGDAEAARLETLATGLPEDLRALLGAIAPVEGNGDPGAHYKQAEIGIQTKVDEPMFFVPGRTSPFAPWDAHFSLYLIQLFGVSAPLLGLGLGDVVVDSGCGYAWTTEWLMRCGFEPIGVDICRTYLEVAIERLGPALPHVLVGDVEHLPLHAGIAKAVFAFESFHHIPDRGRALRGFERVLAEGGTVVLAEPGAAHEHAQVAIDVMQKYGILEKGMELADVQAYAEGTTFGVEQLFLLRLGPGDVHVSVDAALLKDRSAIANNLFRLVKGRPAAAPVVPSVPAPPVGFLSRLKARFEGR